MCDTLCRFSLVKTDVNCRFRISAFSDGAECRVPWSRRGEMPELVVLLLLLN